MIDRQTVKGDVFHPSVKCVIITGYESGYTRLKAEIYFKDSKIIILDLTEHYQRVLKGNSYLVNVAIDGCIQQHLTVMISDGLEVVDAYLLDSYYEKS